MLAAFIYFAIKDRKKKPKEFIKSNFIPLIPVVFIALAYMLYNCARFDNPFEFGHNYLPEFTTSEYGQFNINYFGENFSQLVSQFVPLDQLFNTEFPVSFAFYLANPLYILWWYRSIKNMIKTRKISKTRLLFSVAIILNILLICCHKTLGGWQFGARYTCDMLPFVFLCIMISTKKDTRRGNLWSRLFRCI